MTTVQRIIKYLALAFAAFIIVNIISGILFGLYGLANVLGLTNSDRKDNLNSNMITTSFGKTEVETLKIELEYSNLIIKKGDTLKAETDSKSIICKQDNNGLEIKEEKHNWFSRKDESKLVVYIPENIIFDKTIIETGAGEIKIEDLESKELSLKIGAGKVEIEKLNVTEEARIEGGAGKLEIESGEIKNLDVDMGVGEFDITAKLTGKNDINAGVGKLNLRLTDKTENYKIKVNKGIGSITIDGKETSDNTEYGTGKTFIKVDGGIGSIEIGDGE